MPRKLEDKTGPMTLKLKLFNAMASTVYTVQGQEVVTERFLNVCRPLAHHSTRQLLLVGRDQLPLEALIFA
jgi:hypothetical protein